MSDDAVETLVNDFENNITVAEGEFTGTGVLSPAVCPDASLAVDAVALCTATDTLTRADVNSGSEPTIPALAGAGTVLLGILITLEVAYLRRRHASARICPSSERR